MGDERTYNTVRHLVSDITPSSGPLEVDLCPVQCPDSIKHTLEAAEHVVIIAEMKDDRIVVKTTFEEEQASDEIKELLWKTMSLLYSKNFHKELEG